MRRARGAAVVLVVAACGASQREPVVAPPPSIVEEAPAAIERACFSGTLDNGVCEIFSAALEPLPALATHCRAAGGQWLDACPTDGRVGECSGEGRRAIYYGGALGEDALRSACESDGHTFTP